MNCQLPVSQSDSFLLFFIYHTKESRGVKGIQGDSCPVIDLGGNGYGGDWVSRIPLGGQPVLDSLVELLPVGVLVISLMRVVA